MYWVAISSKTELEKEEKWTSLKNHIANIHDHSENKVFKKCTHQLIERQWLKLGKSNITVSDNTAPGFKLKNNWPTS